MNKQLWLDAAHVFDTWRVIPRIILIAYACWVAHVTDMLLIWYMTLPKDGRTLEASGLGVAIITAITGLFPWVLKIYMDNGNDWSGSSSSSTATVTTTTKT